MKTSHLVIIFGTILINCVAFYDFASVTTKGILGIRLGNFGSQLKIRMIHRMSLVSNISYTKFFCLCLCICLNC